ncbi:TonB-dependent receptor [Chitinophaga tropicalis]|uniref:TonB-dependent receptor plug domain-containing protein n=1 Tax=Chitinophaga tropicalis TaxID=2683588 RepID=A0A7K1UF57_9BACT|nr:TonB-dependent receptor [Chitinophaga tropicalis]MVT12625.1 TonB-dependent receptor plug domain-containing protein [Chitinophaga tropicalis]
MYKKLIVTSLLLLLSTTLLLAQTKYTVSGTVKQKSSGETLIGVTVMVVEKPTIGVITNEYGFYSVSLPEGNYTLRFSYVGYKQELVPVKLESNVTVSISLVDESSLREVVISSKKDNDNLTKASMGTEVLNMKEAAKIPVVFGEKDLVKTIQLLPGVKSNGEGSNGFSVRGGATDQNLILLDEAPVYNASHLLGFFSSFNSDAIKDATIIKGNSPAQYGGRLSSVLDVKMKEGNNKDYQVSGGLGLISSRLTIEGPIQRDRSSFMISGRRTYADLFARLSSDMKDVKLYFYDLNAKANWAINSKNKLYFSGYFGKDVFSVSTLFGSDWGNATATLRWNSILNSKLFSNTSLIYSNYDFNVGFKTNTSAMNFNSHIRDLNLKQDFTWYANANNTVRMGFNIIHHTITPTKAEGTDIVNNKKSRKGLESAVYVSNSWKVSDVLNIDYGLRFSIYNVLGGGLYNIYKGNKLVDSIKLADGKFGKNYYNLEPRISASYRLNSSATIKVGYARNTQSLHLMSNSTGGSPTDAWIGNSYNIKPEIADQFSVGFSKSLNNNAFELNTEAYYKTMANQIDYRDGADINTVPDIESELLFGKGRAYGIEVLLRKKKGILTGWIGYTLSKTERQINGINSNQWYDAKQDRTHDLSIVGIYTLSERWTLSGTFIYNTGNAVTFPTGKYVLNDMVIYQYGTRNADRMPATHRLDISATYERPARKRWQGSWSFGLYNVYGRRNPFAITFKENKTNPQKIDAVQTSLFQWVPSVTYNFKF